jgi:hypothetical protein
MPKHFSNIELFDMRSPFCFRIESEISTCKQCQDSKYIASIDVFNNIINTPCECTKENPSV